MTPTPTADASAERREDDALSAMTVDLQRLAEGEWDAITIKRQHARLLLGALARRDTTPAPQRGSGLEGARLAGDAKVSTCAEFMMHRPAPQREDASQEDLDYVAMVEALTSPQRGDGYRAGLLRAEDFDHKCAVEDCCSYGQKTYPNGCACHVTREQMMLAEIARLRSSANNGEPSKEWLAEQLRHHRKRGDDDEIAAVLVVAGMALNERDYAYMEAAVPNLTAPRVVEQGEPVAWRVWDGQDWWLSFNPDESRTSEALYAAPPAPASTEKVTERVWTFNNASLEELRRNRRLELFDWCVLVTHEDDLGAVRSDAPETHPTPRRPGWLDVLPFGPPRRPRSPRGTVR